MGPSTSRTILCAWSHGGDQGVRGHLDVPDARERFSREAPPAAALIIPNIVTVYDFGEFQSQPYLCSWVRPWLDAGESYPAQGRGVDGRQASMDGGAVCWRGLRASESVVHRDIKPAN